MGRPYEQLKVNNENLLLKEIKAKKTVLTALPPRATFEISRACNFVCKKCCYSANANPQGTNFIKAPEWSLDDIERVADEIFPTMRYTESTLLGEPFLNRNFKWLMDLYKKYGVYYRPTTNASLLTEEKLDIGNGVIDWLKCSFDACNKNLYHKLYLKDMFLQVEKNLKMFSKKRWDMSPMPWFRVGLVLMRSNMNSLIEYADYCNQELGVDDIEIMGLNYANNAMNEEFYFNIPDVVNGRIMDLIDHCIKKKYRLRLPFIQMGTNNALAAVSNLKANNTEMLSRPYSVEVKTGDIFGNHEQIENFYIWSNQDRISTIKADDGENIGVCEFYLRPFLKPPDAREYKLLVEACGSCSTYRFGNLGVNTFNEIYNNEGMQHIRKFMQTKPETDKKSWPVACQKCLCIDALYCEENNGASNVGRRWHVGENYYE